MFLDQAATTGDAGAGTSGSLLATLIPFALVIVVFYFFLIRPQKKQEKEAAKMRDSLQVGDEVTTIGGVIGRVVSIKDETFTLETSRDRTKIRFLRSAIKSVDVKVADLRAVEAAEEKPAEAVEEKPAKKAKKDAE
jgi:preprotein translocase subunit YajC